MNSFDPANLSPHPQAPLPCDLPYGLTWEDLQPVLPGFDPSHRARPQAFASYAKQGLNGGENSCILTLRYSMGEETIFFKSSAGRSAGEAQKYRFLAEQGVATPRLLAVVQKGPAEVILLEFLPAIGIDFSSTEQVNSLLHLAAELNAIPEPPDLFRPTPGLPQAEFDEFVRAALAELANEPGQPAMDAGRWFAAYQAAHKAVEQMPLAVCHNQFYFQQVGWAQRGAARQLVLLDLETLTLAPRFTDIAAILYPLAVYSGRDQLALFHIYLDQLPQRTLITLDFNAAVRELRLLRFRDACQTLPWLAGAAKEPDMQDLVETLALTVNCLTEDMEALGL